MPVMLWRQSTGMNSMASGLSEKIQRELKQVLAARRKDAEERTALMALAGLDLEFAEQTAGEVRQRLALRLGRLCERERFRAGNAGYDLARHCALARVHSRLRLPR
ncbi:MAG: hypothetical protein WAT78_13200 [Rhizobiaceae bacterium]